LPIGLGEHSEVRAVGVGQGREGHGHSSQLIGVAGPFTATGGGEHGGAAWGVLGAAARGSAAEAGEERCSGGTGVSEAARSGTDSAGAVGPRLDMRTLGAKRTGGSSGELAAAHALLLTASAGSSVRGAELEDEGLSVTTVDYAEAFDGDGATLAAVTEALERRVRDGDFSLIYVEEPCLWSLPSGVAAGIAAALTRAAVVSGTAWLVEGFGDAAAAVEGRGVTCWDSADLAHVLQRARAVVWSVQEDELITDHLDGCSFAVAPWMLHESGGQSGVLHGATARLLGSAQHRAGMLGAAARRAEAGGAPLLEAAELGARQAVVGGAVADGPDLTPGIRAACADAAWSPPRFASTRNLRAAPRSHLQMEPFSDSIWPAASRDTRRSKRSRKQQRGRTFPARVVCTDESSSAHGRTLAQQDLDTPEGPISVQQLFYDGVYETHVGRWMQQADAAAAAIQRRRAGETVNMPSVPTVVLDQLTQPAWARGVVFDCSDPTDCRPVRRSGASTVFRGAKQLDRARLRAVAAVLGWGDVDADIVRQAGGGGIEAGSACELLTVLTFHHAGLLDEVEAVAVAVAKDFVEEWTDRPVRHLPFVPCRMLPKNVVMQHKLRVLADGVTVEEYQKPRITTDASDGAAESVNAGVPREGRHVRLPTIQQQARAGAIIGTVADFVAAGEAPVRSQSYVVDAESAFRYCAMQEADLWTQCFVWWDAAGAAGVCVDRRMAFGGAYSPNRFERVSTLVAAHVQRRQAEVDAIHPLPPCAARWGAARRGWQSRGVLRHGSRETSPSYLQVYIDDFSGAALDDHIGNVAHLAGFEIDPVQTAALGGTPAAPGTRVFAHAQAAALGLSEVGLRAAPTKILVGDPIVALGFSVDTGGGRVMVPGKKRATMLADIGHHAGLAAEAKVPLARARTLVGRLVNLSQVSPELAAVLNGGYTATAPIRAQSSEPAVRRMALGSPAHVGWTALLGTAKGLLSANEGVAAAPQLRFPSRGEAGVFTSTTDASGNDGVGGYVFVAGRPDTIVIVSELWPADVQAAKDEDGRPIAERTGRPTFSMPAAELFGALAVPRAAAAALGVQPSAVYAVGDCQPAIGAINRASSGCAQMHAIVTNSRAWCAHWLAVHVPREANVDADRLSHPHLAASVEADARRAGLSVVRAAFLVTDWEALRAAIG
jgi:hypothetical protein